METKGVEKRQRGCGMETKGVEKEGVGRRRYVWKETMGVRGETKGRWLMVYREGDDKCGRRQWV